MTYYSTLASLGKYKILYTNDHDRHNSTLRMLCMPYPFSFGSYDIRHLPKIKRQKNRI